MVIRYQLLLLIYIISYAKIIHSIVLNVSDADTCNVLCRQCNASAVFENNHCECNFADNNDEDLECIQRVQKEIQAIDVNALSDDLTEEERSARGIFKSRRRLRMGDANQVAHYFINGGPSAGHSHFVRASNEAHDTTDYAANSCLDIGNPANDFCNVPPYLSLSNPLVGSPYHTPMYMAPQTVPMVSSPAMPAMPNVDPIYTPILGTINPALSYPIGNGMYDTLNPMVGSVIQPNGHDGPFQHILRAATVPAHLLQNLFTHYLPHNQHFPTHRGILRNTNNNLPNTPTDGKSYSTKDSTEDSTKTPAVSNDLPAATNPSGYNVGASMPGAGPVNPISDSTQIPRAYDANTQYRDLQTPYQYGPLLNILHPPYNGYILQLPLIHNNFPQNYLQSTFDPTLTSANIPNSDDTHNTYDTNNKHQTENTAIDQTDCPSDEKADKTNNKNTIQASISKENKKEKSESN